MVSQALIAIGGSALRLRSAGVAVPISKSFISLCGKPLLYWSLLSLHGAGIRRLVLCGDNPMCLHEADILLRDFPVSFSDVSLLQDPGLGVHGLPYQVMSRHPDLLDEEFIFECGHSLMEPSHYERIAELKRPDVVVLSAFEPHAMNVRQPVRIDGSSMRIELAVEEGADCIALAHPMVIDRSYVARLPSLGFDISRIIGTYGATSKIRYAMSNLPPEFDIAEEMQDVLGRYRSYMTSVSPLPHQINS
jgi:hypothetical protein